MLNPARTFTVTQKNVQVRDNVVDRAFKLLRLPEAYSPMTDGIQILRYEIGQAYIAHHDYFPATQSPDHEWNPAKGGSNRFATVFLYLSDVEEGGQTVFPSQVSSKIKQCLVTLIITLTAVQLCI